MAEPSVPESTRHRVRERWRHNEHRIAMYRVMLDVAKRCADAYDTNRIGDLIAELEAQREDIIDWADRNGMGPDELDPPRTGASWAWKDDDTDRGGNG